MPAELDSVLLVERSPPLRDVEHPSKRPFLDASAQNCPVLPAELDGVLAVGATGNTSQKAYYSNYGSLFVDVRGIPKNGNPVHINPMRVRKSTL